MSLRDLEIKIEYRSLTDNIVKDFYIPLLKESIIYKRAVGFFSSTSLVEISKGIAQLAQNGGKIKIVASPSLSEEDINAIRSGYARREVIIQDKLLASLADIDTYDKYSKTRLNLLANLIADGIVDIKIAYTEDEQQWGIYHEKMGIIEDRDGNKIAFSGSMNETSNAMMVNYETIDVFTNWNSSSDCSRVEQKEKAFNSIWNDIEPGIRVISFPDINQAIIDRYKKTVPDYNIDNEEFNYIGLKNEAGARTPTEISLYDYQLAAINAWEKNNFCGIFDMATGTGKTFTALGALAKLSEQVNDDLTVIIVCPYQHLVEQWVEDIIKFNIKPIIGYSNSPQNDWQQRLKKAVRQQCILKSRRFFCFVTTNATFASQFVQNQINQIKKSICLIADEAHNLGTERILKLLDDRFKYRLALSATLERHFDKGGSDALKNFFGEICIEYTLGQAIRDGRLTPYKYYPIVVTLNEDELVKFNELTRKIMHCIVTDRNGHIKLSESGIMLAIQRARLVAGAYAKIEVLKKTIVPYRNSNHMLIYCGATTINSDIEDNETKVAGMRQITAITRMLGNDLGMNVAKFTADEDINERTAIKTSFAEGKDLQAIIAIKCLDEGVNIPSIQKAFILASTTNPKEYIQRSGRVLRLSPETAKSYAEIFDFITLPRSLDETYNMSKSQIKAEASLPRNEVRRIQEFCDLAINPVEGLKLIDEISEAYYLNEANEEEVVVDGFTI